MERTRATPGVLARRRTSRLAWRRLLPPEHHGQRILGRLLLWQGVRRGVQVRHALRPQVQHTRPAAAQVESQRSWVAR
jgi:hypothetical protein